MKGYLIKNNTNKILEIVDKNKNIFIEPNYSYFYNKEILTGQIKLFESRKYISVEYIDDFNYNINMLEIKEPMLNEEIIDNIIIDGLTIEDIKEDNKKRMLRKNKI